MALNTLSSARRLVNDFLREGIEVPARVTDALTVAHGVEQERVRSSTVDTSAWTPSDWHAKYEKATDLKMAADAAIAVREEALRSLLSDVGEALAEWAPYEQARALYNERAAPLAELGARAHEDDYHGVAAKVDLSKVVRTLGVPTHLMRMTRGDPPWFDGSFLYHQALLHAGHVRTLCYLVSFEGLTFPDAVELAYRLPRGAHVISPDLAMRAADAGARLHADSLDDVSATMSRLGWESHRWEINDRNVWVPTDRTLGEPRAVSAGLEFQAV